jgi:mycolipenoyl-CoA---2-(long-chain-fatty acyl)-trehalose mycolipenoyltransferase / long-chain-acyl-CoA---trehalose acyltransferase
MHMQEFADFHPPLGDLVIWQAETTQPLPAGEWSVPSHDEEARLRQAERKQRARQPSRRWSASVIPVSESLDFAAAESAFLRFIRSQRILRCGFSVEATAIRRYFVEADRVRLIRHDVGRFVARPELLACLLELFDTHTNPLQWPAYLLGAIRADEGSLLFMVFDHLLTDLQSQAVAVNVFSGLYREQVGRAAPTQPEGSPCVRPGPMSRIFGPGSPELSSATAYWSDFLSGGRCTLPLSLWQGPTPLLASTPQRGEEIVLMGSALTKQFDDWCTGQGASLFPGLLAAAGLAARKLAGADAFRTMISVRTRPDTAAPTIGWFVNDVPVAFPLLADQDPLQIVMDAQQACLSAWRHRLVPYEQVMQSLPITAKSENFSWFSYLDFTLIPASDSRASADATLLMCPSFGAGVDLWFNRTSQGVLLYMRYPATNIVRQGLQLFATTMAQAAEGLLADQASTC